MRALVFGGCAMLLLAHAPVLAQATAYERAVTARHSGQPVAAAQLFEEWLTAHPDDTDALVQYGYALLAIGRIDEAEQAFDRVLTLAPEYADANQGLERIAKRRASAIETRKAFIQIEGALSKLEPGQNDWREFGIAASVPLNARTTIDARGTWYERFETRDTEFGVLASHRADDAVWLRLGGSFTPSAAFRLEHGLTAGIDFRIAKHTVSSFDTAYQQFPLQTVWSFRPGVTQYFGGGRYALAVHARAVAADGADILVGGSLRGDYFADSHSRIFAGFATGPETDLGEVRDTTSLYGGGEFPVTDAISLSGSIAQEWRAVGSDRTEGRVGLKVSL